MGGRPEIKMIYRKGKNMENYEQGKEKKEYVGHFLAQKEEKFCKILYVLMSNRNYFTVQN